MVSFSPHVKRVENGNFQALAQKYSHTGLKQPSFRPWSAMYYFVVRARFSDILRTRKPRGPKAADNPIGKHKSIFLTRACYTSGPFPRMKNGVEDSDPWAQQGKNTYFPREGNTVSEQGKPTSLSREGNEYLWASKRLINSPPASHAGQGAHMRAYNHAY